MRESRAASDSPLRTLLIAACVSLGCAAIVSTTAVLLRPRQEANREQERLRHMRDLVRRLPGIEAILEGEAPPVIESHVIELASGSLVRDLDPATYDAVAAAQDGRWSVELTREQDIAHIQRRAKYATVHTLRRDGRLVMVILPVYGSGYDSTLHGFLALEGDGNTVVALTFFEHEETPGLGAEIDNPSWRAQWRGKKVRDEQGLLRIGVAEGRIAPGAAEAAFQVDGIAGATETSQGVSNLLRFWLGEDGYGPFLGLLRSGGGP